LEASVRRNLTASILKSISRAGVIIHRRESGRVQELADAFEIDTRRLPDNVSQLSGGNQQKVALAKATATQPKLLLLNEPTRGIDVGARSEIYRRLKDLAKLGLTIVFYSTDLEEVAQLADRVVNFFRGNIVTVKPACRTSVRGILYEILHGQELPTTGLDERKTLSPDAPEMKLTSRNI